MNYTVSPLLHALRIAVPLLFGTLSPHCAPQSTAPAPDQKAAATSRKPAETEKNPAQIELLETKYRFETNGDSHKDGLRPRSNQQ